MGQHAGSRRLKDLQAPIRQAIAELSATGRAPRPSEVAAHLGIEVDEVIETLDAANAYDGDSLEFHLAGSDATLVKVLGHLDPALALAEDRHGLREALAALQDREHHIVVLRFFGDLTQTQIGARVGISQMHVSRILARTLGVLRTQLTSAHAVTDDGAASA